MICAPTPTRAFALAEDLMGVDVAYTSVSDACLEQIALWYFASRNSMEWDYGWGHFSGLMTSTRWRGSPSACSARQVAVSVLA